MSIADKLTTIADNQQKVYDTGYEKGNQEGYTEGYDSGQKSQYDEFWTWYLPSINYDASYRFSGMGWCAQVFRPPKGTILQPTNSAQRMFASFDYYGRSGADFDLVEHLKEIGVTLDFSKCLNMQETFSEARIYHIGVVDITASDKAQYGTFTSKFIRKIDEIIVNENKKYSSLFTSASALEEITITGTIGQNGFSVQNSPLLTKESIISIINALSDTTTALTVTLSKTAVNNAFETAKGNADGSTSEEWAALIATKQNWTISLV